MDSQRNFFIIALLFASFIIWQVWEEDKNPQCLQETTQIKSNAKENTNQISAAKKQKKIKIRTDILELTVSTQGGDIEKALLLNHLKEMNSKEPFQLLTTTPDFIYQAQSGLSIYNEISNTDDILYPIYSVNRDMFALQDNQNELIVPMTWKDNIGNIFTKTFILKRGEYTVDVEYRIQNSGTIPLITSSFGQLKQSIKLPPSRAVNSDNFSLHTFRGAAYSTQNNKYEKCKFNSIVNNQNLDIKTEGGWVAMLQQYFATAWIPRNSGINNFYTTHLGNKIAVIGYKSQPTVIQPGGIGLFRSTLWIGPEIQDQMAIVAPHLNLIVDYGWLWFISQPLFNLLKFIHGFLGNWGFSIIVITLIVRVIMYPLTKAQYTSMAKMCMLQPKIQAIRNRLSNDKQRQSQEIVAMYRSEKVNPLGGCFPPLIQMPIFLALYYMLTGSVELRHAPFALWIRDLSAQDPYYVLPILMGATMLCIQKMSPSAVADQTQKKIMNFMPLIFSIFFLWFPSGLVLYYIVSNLVTIVQQQIIYRSLKEYETRYKIAKKKTKF